MTVSSLAPDFSRELFPKSVSDDFAFGVDALLSASSASDDTRGGPWTTTEPGLNDFEVDPWYGLMAPAATPAPVVTRLNQITVTALAEPAVQERLAGLGVQVIANSPTGFAAALAADLIRYAAAARAGNITAD